MEKVNYRFKSLFLAYLFGYIPFALLGAILSLVNVLPVSFNGHSYYGIVGFAISILTVPFVGFVFGIINWIYLNIGASIYNYIVKMLSAGRKGDT